MQLFAQMHWLSFSAYQCCHDLNFSAFDWQLCAAAKSLVFLTVITIIIVICLNGVCVVCRRAEGVVAMFKLQNANYKFCCKCA